MSEYLFLSEYCGANKTAWVCQRREEGDFVAIGYQGGLPKVEFQFATEQLADDFAEDWILITTPE